MSSQGLLVHQNWYSNSNEQGNASTTVAFEFTHPGIYNTGSLANNCLVLTLFYPSGLTVNSIVDNKSNTWSTTPISTVTDSVNSVTSSVFVIFSAAAGTNLVTVTLSAKGLGCSAIIQEFYDLTAIDVHKEQSITITASGQTVSSTSVTTTVANDLILHIGQCSDDGAGGFAGGNGVNNNEMTLTTPASGYTLLGSDLIQGKFCEFFSQSAAGPVNPAAAITYGLGGNSTWESHTVAFKTGSAGTAPTADAQGIITIYHARVSCTSGTTGQNIPIQFPTFGNAFAYLISDPFGSTNCNSISGSVSGSWTTRAAATGDPQLSYKLNGTSGSNELLTLGTTDPEPHGYYQGCFYDLCNCGTNTTIAVGVLSAFGPGNSTPTQNITPGFPVGRTLSTMALNTGPPDSVQGPSGASMVSVFYTGQTDLSNMDNGDCHGVYGFSTAATQGWIYHDTAATSGGNALEFAIAALPTGGQSPILMGQIIT